METKKELLDWLDEEILQFEIEVEKLTQKIGENHIDDPGNFYCLKRLQCRTYADAYRDIKILLND
jgi:hypothetical protein